MKKFVERLDKEFIPSSRNDFLPRFLKPRTLFILAVVLLVIKFLIFSWFYYYPKTSQFAIVTSSSLIEMVNKERVVLGLNPLNVNQQLVQAAQAKAQDMLNNNYFDHTSPNGITPWFWLDRAGYKYVTAGENLAKDFTDSEFVHQSWMNSSSHRKNILNSNYQEIGIAVVEGTINGKNTILAVQFFALSAEAPMDIGAKAEEKPISPVTVSDTSIELVKGGPSYAEATEDKEQSSLKGPLVLKQRDNIENILEKPKSILSTIKGESENLVQKTYFIILGVLILVLFLTIFINIRVQYPKLIFTALIFIIFIAAIACFNGQEFLNKGLEVLCVSL